MPLVADDVKVWELDLARLGRSVAAALGCEPRVVNLQMRRTKQIASLGGAPLPILLAAHADMESFEDGVAQLVARLANGFVLLAPTSRFCSAVASELLGRVNAGLVDLESTVKILPSGKLVALKTADELFGPYLKHAGSPHALPAGARASKKGEVSRPDFSGSRGRLRWDNDCKEIRLGRSLYILENRKKARFCIQFLAMNGAFDQASARHLESEIDPFVRNKARMEALPESSKGNLRIQHYFHGSKQLQQLCAALIKSAGSGRYYLHTE